MWPYHMRWNKYDSRSSLQLAGYLPHGPLNRCRHGSCANLCNLFASVPICPECEYQLRHQTPRRVTLCKAFRQRSVVLNMLLCTRLSAGHFAHAAPSCRIGTASLAAEICDYTGMDLGRLRPSHKWGYLMAYWEYQWQQN